MDQEQLDDSDIADQDITQDIDDLILSQILKKRGDQINSIIEKSTNIKLGEIMMNLSKN